MRAPVHEPAAPCVTTNALPVHGAGQLPPSKSTPKGVSPMKNELVSAVTPEQLGVAPGWLFTNAVEYGRFLVAQQGKPQSSPCRMGTSFSRPAALAE